MSRPVAPFLHEVFKEAVEIWLPALRSRRPRGAGDDQFQRLADARVEGLMDSAHNSFFKGTAGAE